MSLKNCWTLNCRNELLNADRESKTRALVKMLQMLITASFPPSVRFTTCGPNEMLNENSL